MGFLKLLSRKEFWRIIAYGLVLYLLAFILVILSLRWYTNHNKSFPVPDFKGLHPDRVAEIAKSRKLSIEIIDSTYIPYLQKGSVIDQHPNPGVNVKKHRTIFITINAFNQAKVEMPVVVGVSFRQAKTTLESRGFKVGRLIYKNDFAKNYVLDQQYKGESIEKGTMIEKGQHIDLVLGNGLSRTRVLVPNLENLVYQRAVNEITDAYFNVGSVKFDTSVHSYIDSMNAVVWKQSPAFYKNGKAAMGSKISIWLTKYVESKQQNDSIKSELPN